MSKPALPISFVPDPSQTIPPAFAGLPGFSSPYVTDLEPLLPDPFTVEPVVREVSAPATLSSTNLVVVGTLAAVAGVLLVFSSAALLTLGGLTLLL